MEQSQACEEVFVGVLTNGRFVSINPSHRGLAALCWLHGERIEEEEEEHLDFEESEFGKLMKRMSEKLYTKWQKDTAQMREDNQRKTMSLLDHLKKLGKDSSGELSS